MESKKFYLGLDIGTNSVGFCVTDENYNIIKNTKLSMMEKAQNTMETIYGVHAYLKRQVPPQKEELFARIEKDSKEGDMLLLK